MKKLYKNLNNTLYDVAVAPIILSLLGVPLLLILIVGGVIALSIKYVSKSSKYNTHKPDEDSTDKNDDKKE